MYSDRVLVTHNSNLAQLRLIVTYPQAPFKKAVAANCCISNISHSEGVKGVYTL